MDAPIGPQADVWSFGLMAFALLTGRHYFSSANAQNAPTAAVLREVVLDPLLPASERARQLGRRRLTAGRLRRVVRAMRRSLAESRFPEAQPPRSRPSRGCPAPATSALSWTPVTPPAERVRARSSIVPSLPASRGAGHGDRDARAPEPRASRARDQPVALHDRRRDEPLARRWPASVRSLRALWGLGAPSSSGGLVVARRRRARSRPRPPSLAPASTAAAIAPHRDPAARVQHDRRGARSGAGRGLLERRTAAKGVVRMRTAPDEIRVEARDGDRTVEAIEVFAHGTATGFQDLAAGSCDMAMASRRIRPTRRQARLARGPHLGGKRARRGPRRHRRHRQSVQPGLGAHDHADRRCLRRQESRRWSELGGKRRADRRACARRPIGDVRHLRAPGARRDGHSWTARRATSPATSSPTRSPATRAPSVSSGCLTSGARRPSWCRSAARLRSCLRR